MKKLLLILLMAMAMCLVVSCDTPVPEETEDGVTTTAEETTIPPQEDFSDVSNEEGITDPVEEPTEESTEEPTEESTEEFIEEPTEDTTEPVEDETEEAAPMPQTAVDALMTYTDVLPSNIASYKRKLEDVPVERVMEAIEYIETASEKLGVVNEGGYYLEGGDYKIYLRRKIAFSLDTTDGEVVWQVLSYVLRDNSQK